jgi:adenylate cyclase 9
MIVAIKQFDADRGQEVNMRVGVHTGTVMCGLVGTKRFKFDVFSNDVILANEMESSGVCTARAAQRECTGQAGRVHISDVTAKFLDNEYVLEPDKPFTVHAHKTTTSNIPSALCLCLCVPR